MLSLEIPSNNDFNNLNENTNLSSNSSENGDDIEQNIQIPDQIESNDMIIENDEEESQRQDDYELFDQRDKVDISLSPKRPLLTSILPQTLGKKINEDVEIEVEIDDDNEEEEQNEVINETENHDQNNLAPPPLVKVASTEISLTQKQKVLSRRSKEITKESQIPTETVIDKQVLIEKLEKIKRDAMQESHSKTRNKNIEFTKPPLRRTSDSTSIIPPQPTPLPLVQPVLADQKKHVLSNTTIEDPMFQKNQTSNIVSQQQVRHQAPSSPNSTHSLSSSTSASDCSSSKTIAIYENIVLVPNIPTKWNEIGSLSIETNNLDDHDDNISSSAIVNPIIEPTSGWLSQYSKREMMESASRCGFSPGNAQHILGKELYFDCVRVYGKQNTVRIAGSIYHSNTIVRYLICGTGIVDMYKFVDIVFRTRECSFHSFLLYLKNVHRTIFIITCVSCFAVLAVLAYKSYFVISDLFRLTTPTTTGGTGGSANNNGDQTGNAGNNNNVSNSNSSSINPNAVVSAAAALSVSSVLSNAMTKHKLATDQSAQGKVLNNEHEKDEMAVEKNDNEQTLSETSSRAPPTLVPLKSNSNSNRVMKQPGNKPLKKKKRKVSVSFVDDDDVIDYRKNKSNKSCIKSPPSSKMTKSDQSPKQFAKRENINIKKSKLNVQSEEMIDDHREEEEVEQNNNETPSYNNNNTTDQQVDDDHPNNVTDDYNQDEFNEHKDNEDIIRSVRLNSVDFLTSDNC